MCKSSLSIFIFEGNYIMEADEGFTKYRSYLLQLVEAPISEAVKEKQIDSEFCMEQTEPELKLYNGFSEISGIIDTLKLIETFVSIDPPDVKDINYSNYLNYHVHNYFQEMYILKERLNAYLILIQRLYQNKVDRKLLQEVMKPLFAMVKDSLNNIAGSKGVRNKHVHEKKYSDNEMNWLVSTSFLSEFDDEFTRESKKAYLTVKKKWTITIGRNNKELEKLIDQYFSMCYGIVTHLDDAEIKETG